VGGRVSCFAAHRYGFAPELPAVLGQESVGVIDSLGEGSTASPPPARDQCGDMGIWQEYLVGDAARVLPVPDGMSASTAAQLLTNPLTALLLVTRELDVQPGEWPLQTAAGSTVGRLVPVNARAPAREVNRFGSPSRQRIAAAVMSATPGRRCGWRAGRRGGARARCVRRGL
jgi:hypothetical protein